MSIQQLFSKFHKTIKVETDELRDKRDILVDKIRASLKKAGKPLPDVLNQGSYIYGVGVKPVGDVEYDIDVGLDFPITSHDNDAKSVRKWVYDAIHDHTDKVEDRGPCIRVRYAKGYHVDLVVYARYKSSENQENYQLAQKDGSWKPAEPKRLKEFVANARKPFADTKDASGSDQLQRVTRYLKRWNDEEIPDDSPDKPFGLATLLLVIKHLTAPVLDSLGESDDLEALVRISRAVNVTSGRIVVYKPTQEFEDVFAKLSESAMSNLKKRFESLFSDLEKTRGKSDEEAARILRTQFGEDFPDALKKSEDAGSSDRSRIEVSDMQAAIPSFSSPAQPWCDD